MDEKDSMTPDTIPQSTPVDGTVSAGRRVRIQGVREPSGVGGAPGVPVGRHGPG